MSETKFRHEMAKRERGLRKSRRRAERYQAQRKRAAFVVNSGLALAKWSPQP